MQSLTSNSITLIVVPSTFDSLVAVGARLFHPTPISPSLILLLRWTESQIREGSGSHIANKNVVRYEEWRHYKSLNCFKWVVFFLFIEAKETPKDWDPKCLAWNSHRPSYSRGFLWWCHLFQWVWSRPLLH